MEIIFTEKATQNASIVIAGYEKGVFSSGMKRYDQQMQGMIKRSVQSEQYDGKLGSIIEILTPPIEHVNRILLVGTGKQEDDLTQNKLQKLGGYAVKRLMSCHETKLVFDLKDFANPEQIAEIAFGASLASYRFDRYKTNQKSQKARLEKLVFITSSKQKSEQAFKDLSALSEGVKTARELVLEPANILYPKSYAKRIKDLSHTGLEVEILDEKEMTRLGFDSLLAVGMGSERESQTVVMKWNGAEKEDPSIAFVGKGVTFDTGGISLKPSQNMDEMKGDMGGSACVVGLMQTLAKRNAKVNAVGIVGLVENMPDAKAQRPGDIVKSLSGKTIEVLNTDAEGRLVLADILWYVQEMYKPEYVIDLATLTGAIIISLGHEYAGVFSNSDSLSESLTKAGKTSGEPVWRLPLGKAYDQKIDSNIADIKNIGSGRDAGSILAAQFLQRFVQKGIKWAHIDIAGVAWKSKNSDPREPVWSTGYGVRLLNQWVKDSFEIKA